jgi:phage baseplate assembly protein W
MEISPTFVPTGRLVLSSFTALVGNDLWNLGGAFQFDFNATPNSIEEVLQNVYEIWSVPLGSQVLQRAFGNDVSWIDSPGNIAQLQAQTAFLLAVSKWEQRATFTKIQFTLDTEDYLSGIYSLYVELSINLNTAIASQIFSGPTPDPVWVLDNDMTGGDYPDVELDNLTI